MLITALRFLTLVVIILSALSPAFSQDKPGAKACEAPKDGKVWEPPAATISESIVHHQYINQLDGKGGTEAAESADQRSRWCLNYKNGTARAWSGFRIELTADNTINQIREALRSASVKGFGGELFFRNKSNDFNKEVSLDINSAENSGKSRPVQPGESVDIQIESGCFGPPVADVIKNLNSCQYHLDVQPVLAQDICNLWQLRGNCSGELDPQTIEFVNGTEGEQGYFSGKLILSPRCHIGSESRRLTFLWRDIRGYYGFKLQDTKGAVGDNYWVVYQILSPVRGTFTVNGKKTTVTAERDDGSPARQFMDIPKGATSLDSIEIDAFGKTLTWRPKS